MQQPSPSELDVGTGYGRKPSTYMAELTEVGPGTPMGELMRRYWQPIAVADAAGPTPRKVRMLGENLILFRDGSGRAGLLHERCAHRGTTLYFGKVEEDGIRCCYHGWKFDVTGRCLDQPCEPGGGRARQAIRQPWYPIRERYGLIFTYMGPPEKKPVLPRYQTLEELGPDEHVVAEEELVPGTGPQVYDCNWLQNYENVLDTFHVPILHQGFSVDQFKRAALAQMPKVRWEPTPLGVNCVTDREQPDGTCLHRVMEAVVPNIQVIMPPHEPTGPVRRITWTVPIDDTHMRHLIAARVEKGFQAPLFRFDGVRTWSEMTPEQRREMPGDYEAQSGQGPVTLHSEEHLATTDIGVVMLRRLLREQVARVARGEDPLGVSFDPNAPPIRFGSGQFVRPAEPSAAA